MFTPEYLYKVISREEWGQSLIQKQVVSSSIDQIFIHLAKEDQIARVVQKFWKNRDPFVLKLRVNKLVGRLIYETNPGGTTHSYHLYEGKIPVDAVQDVSKVHKNNN